VNCVILEDDSVTFVTASLCELMAVGRLVLQCQVLHVERGFVWC